MQNVSPRRTSARFPDAQERTNVRTGMRKLYAPVVDASFDSLLRDIASAATGARRNSNSR